MKRKAILIVLMVMVVSAFALSGCGKNSKDAKTDDSKAKVTEEEKKVDETKKAEEAKKAEEEQKSKLEENKKVLQAAADNPSEFDPAQHGEHASRYRYIFEDLDGDGMPELMLESNDDRDPSLYYCNIVKNVDGKAVRVSDAVIPEGVAGAGGFRGVLLRSADGNGFYHRSWGSGNGIVNESKYTIVNEDGKYKMKTETLREYNLRDTGGFLDTEGAGDPFEWE